ncbi:DNA-directed RNA polymerase subunit L [archaeon]|nr:DNA-directed RNA polymerase subunit L [archaeon]
MRLIVKEERPNQMKFEIEGESYTFCILLQDVLINKVKGVEFAGYYIGNPLIDNPVFSVITSGEISARDALRAASEKAVNWLNQVKDALEKALSKE